MRAFSRLGYIGQKSLAGQPNFDFFSPVLLKLLTGLHDQAIQPDECLD